MKVDAVRAVDYLHGQQYGSGSVFPMVVSCSRTVIPNRPVGAPCRIAQIEIFSCLFFAVSTR